MSEYQYYEFQAVDRRLTEKQIAELRSYSTRARITPTSFVNEYSWGDFKGDEDVWVEKYFDAFLHLANWGTHVFKLNLPAGALDVNTARLYCVGPHAASVREKSGRLIFTFVSEEEGGGEWIAADGLLSSLIAVRAELARGDLRALYLAWLLCVQDGDLGDEAIEPPVPPGLAQLSAALESFVAFLRIDPDLVRAATTASAPLVAIEPGSADARAWLAKLPVAEKDDFLARVMAGDDGAVTSELLRRMQAELAGDRPSDKSAARRNVAELRRAGELAADERERVEAEQAAKETERRERAAARARAKHLDQLAGREPKLWAKVEGLAATTTPKNYDQALELLLDLRDLAARSGESDFRRRLDALQTAHARKRALIDRMRKAGL